MPSSASSNFGGGSRRTRSRAVASPGTASRSRRSASIVVLRARRRSRGIAGHCPCREIPSRTFNPRENCPLSVSSQSARTCHCFQRCRGECRQRCALPLIRRAHDRDGLPPGSLPQSARDRAIHPRAPAETARRGQPIRVRFRQRAIAPATPRNPARVPRDQIAQPLITLAEHASRAARRRDRHRCRGDPAVSARQDSSRRRRSSSSCAACVYSALGVAPRTAASRPVSRSAGPDASARCRARRS